MKCNTKPAKKKQKTADLIGTWLVFGGIGEMRVGLSWPRFVGCIGYCNKNLNISVGVAKIHIFFTSQFQDSHLETIPFFLVQENELWRDSVKLLTETFLGCCFGNPFFQFLGTWNWLFFSVWGGRNLCGKMRGMRFWKTLEFWWSFFHVQGPNISRPEVFLGPIWWIIAAYWGQNSEEEIGFQPVSIYVGCCWCWAFNPLQPPGRVLSGLNFFWTWYLGWGHGHTVDTSIWNLVSTSWVW